MIQKHLKKAAMFGLDARIALAIFGALSIIVGASLFKAIGHTKAIRLVTQAEEIAKAVESYMLDTGTDVTYSDVDSYYNIKALVTNTENVADWNGPYISWNQSSSLAEGLSGVKSTYFIWGGDNASGDIFISLHASSTQSSNPVVHCVALKPCAYYIRIGNVDKSVASKIDLYIDGVADYNSGRALVSVRSGNFMNVWVRGPLKLSQDL